MPEITELLDAWNRGDAVALDGLISLAYEWAGGVEVGKCTGCMSPAYRREVKVRGVPASVVAKLPPL